ncbi:MAG: VOC family protein [Mycobacteriales bacterium]
MTEGMRTIIFPVRDLDRAKALYGALLGTEPTSDSPYYVGFSVGDQQLGLDPNGHRQGMTGPVGYWHVDDIGATIERLVAAGGQVQQGAHGVGGTRQIATVADADGNVIGLLQD